MFQKQTKARFVQLLISMGQWEYQLAQIRNNICQIEDFEPYCAFHRIAEKKIITIESLSQFLQDNNFPSDDVIKLLNLYSSDSEPQLVYKDFLRLVMPTDDPKLRSEFSKKNPGLLDEGERLSYEIELGLCQLFSTEIEALKSLETIKILLMKCKDYSPEEAFFKIDVDSTDKIDFDSLSAFLQQQGTLHLIEDEQILYAIRYLDRDADGIVPLDDFCRIIYPIEKITSNIYPKLLESKAKQSRHQILASYINLDRRTNINPEQLSLSKSRIAQSNEETHLAICHLLKEIIKAEKVLELERQDLALNEDFNVSDLFTMISDGQYITTIQMDEFLNKQLQMDPAREHLFLFFRQYDSDKDGRLQYSDFIEAFAPRQREYYNIITSNKNKLQSQTWSLIRKLLLLIFQCESVIETTKINLNQLMIDENAQFRMFGGSGGILLPKDLRKALSISGFQATEKEIWLLCQRCRTDKFTKQQFFELLAPKTI